MGVMELFRELLKKGYPDYSLEVGESFVVLRRQGKIVYAVPPKDLALHKVEEIISQIERRQ
ncbi:MAG: hypothetical protein AAB730_01160 [Patescibacteria group bacterium]